MKEGPKSPDYEVATELQGDDEIIGEKELRLIETVIGDIVRMVLNDQGIEGENGK